MRFTRFPRVERPTPPSGRRVAAAQTGVQAEKDRFPLFPELVTHHTPEARLAAIDRQRVEWWQDQAAIFELVSGGRPALRCACFRPDLATEFSGTGNRDLYPVIRPICSA